MLSDATLVESREHVVQTERHHPRSPTAPHQVAWAWGDAEMRHPREEALGY